MKKSLVPLVLIIGVLLLVFAYTQKLEADMLRTEIVETKMKLKECEGNAEKLIQQAKEAVELAEEKAAKSKT